MWFFHMLLCNIDGVGILLKCLALWVVLMNHSRPSPVRLSTSIDALPFVGSIEMPRSVGDVEARNNVGR